MEVERAKRAKCGERATGREARGEWRAEVGKGELIRSEEGRERERERGRRKESALRARKKDLRVKM